jgi:dissimilatory sulfite reductase related protein
MSGPTASDLQPVVRKFGQREIVFDNEGFFNDFADWNEEVCAALATECGLAALTENHWQVIRFLRKFYSQNGRAPLNAQLKSGAGMSLLTLESMFPGGIKTGARRLAGLPNPKTCN